MNTVATKIGNGNQLPTGDIVFKQDTNGITIGHVAATHAILDGVSATAANINAVCVAGMNTVATKIVAGNQLPTGNIKFHQDAGGTTIGFTDADHATLVTSATR
jgi:hypothetical protein